MMAFRTSRCRGFSGTVSITLHRVKIHAHRTRLFECSSVRKFGQSSGTRTPASSHLEAACTGTKERHFPPYERSNIRTVERSSRSDQGHEHLVGQAHAAVGEAQARPAPLQEAGPLQPVPIPDRKSTPLNS